MWVNDQLHGIGITAADIVEGSYDAQLLGVIGVHMAAVLYHVAIKTDRKGCRPEARVVPETGREALGFSL